MHRSLIARCSWAFGLVLLAGVLLAGCGGDGGPARERDGHDASTATGGIHAGLQYNGSVVLGRAAAGKPTSTVVGTIEISAPILPDVAMLYGPEVESFPANLAGEEALVHAVALRFDDLLPSCAGEPAYAGITLSTPGGDALGAAELAANYELVARCAYERHTAKPYWIPRLVDDVDICGRELGAEWHLFTAADLASLSASDLRFVADTLSGASGGFGGLYFSLRVYARGAGGALLQAHLDPAASPQLEPLPVAASSTTHLEGDLGLRCVRATKP